MDKYIGRMCLRSADLSDLHLCSNAVHTVDTLDRPLSALQ